MKTNEEHRVFEFNDVRVFFKHTGHDGQVHPYNYLEWMSYAREAFFQELVPNFLELCNSDIKMVTSLVEFELLEGAIFGDRIKLRIFSKNVKRLRFDVIFEFCNMTDGNKLIGSGRQQLTFLETSGRPTRIPEDLKRVVLEFEEKLGEKEEIANP